MPETSKEKRAQYNKKHYQNRLKKAKTANDKALLAAKTGKSCEKCHIRTPLLLDLYIRGFGDLKIEDADMLALCKNPLVLCANCARLEFTPK